MSPIINRLIPAMAVALLSACDDSFLAPEREQASTLSAARGDASPLSTAPVSASQIRISWSDNVGNETGWEIHRSTTGASGTFSFLITYGANSVEHTDGGLAPLTEYCYKVRSYRRQGSKISYSAFTNVSCSRTFALPPPAAPSEVNAKPMDGQSAVVAITITWKDNSTDETGFVIERAESPEGPWTSVPGPVQHNVPVETRLCYRVFARRDTVLSQPSNVDCTHFPKAASGVAAAASAGAIDVTWSDNSAVEDAYVIERATNEGYGPPGFYAYAAIATLPANTAAFHDAAVSGNTRYWYRVWVVREGARAAMSNEGSASIATSVPDAPADARAAPQSSSGVYVYAVPGSTVADGFRLERSADGVTGWTVAATHTSSGISDTGRQPEQNVCYRMIAFNALGESPPSNVACAVPPAAPSEVTVTTLADGSTQVTWRDNSNVEDGFELWFLYEVCDWGECQDDLVSYFVEPNTTSLISSYNRFFGMHAINDGGYSDWVASPAAASVSGSTVALRARVPAPHRPLPEAGVRAPQQRSNPRRR
jgi:hypothetical protein